MKFLTKALLILYVLLMVSACTSKHTKKLDSKPTATVKNVDFETQPLCHYTKNKGIAEMTGKLENSYSFVFFPGNIEFTVSAALFAQTPNMGEEFKAIYEELINDKAACHQPPPTLVELPH